MTRKQTHPRGPLLYLSQSEGVLAALRLSGGCQISSASACQFTLENARRYLWWAVQSCITKTSYWKRSKNPEKETFSGVFPPYSRSRVNHLFILFHLEIKHVFIAFVCLLGLVGCVILPIAPQARNKANTERMTKAGRCFLNHEWAWTP